MGKLMANDSIIEVLPVAVGKYRLGRSLSVEEKDYLNSLEHRPNTANVTTVNTHVLDNPVMQDIRSFISRYIDEYVARTNPVEGYNLRFVITQSWLNITKANQHHPSHYHPNSLLSGVFYVQASAAKDAITFSNPFATPAFRYVSSKKTKYNSQEIEIPVETGMLLIFPSTLWHGVKPKNDNSIRVSLAFNVFVKGTLGKNEYLDELIV